MNNDKQALRQFFRQKRDELPLERIEEAQRDLFDILWGEISIYPLVLSFSSTKEEIDLWEINLSLAKEKRLLLPLIMQDTLMPYHIDDLEKQLTPSVWNIYEPNPEICQKANISEIGCILVPGLGFDLMHHRLGYGGGHYDRFLSKIKDIPTFGVGYKEQLIHDSLPIEPHDIHLSKLFLL